MTSMPASRSARAMILAPRSWPSRPGLATTTRILLWVLDAEEDIGCLRGSRQARAVGSREASAARGAGGAGPTPRGILERLRRQRALRRAGRAAPARPRTA